MCALKYQVMENDVDKHYKFHYAQSFNSYTFSFPNVNSNWNYTFFFWTSLVAQVDTYFTKKHLYTDYITFCFTHLYKIKSPNTIKQSR